VPFYLLCPHCEHPQVVAPHRRGKTVICRQCGRPYRTAKTVNLVQPIMVSSLEDLREIRSTSHSASLIDI
jgi:hypothetical protein